MLVAQNSLGPVCPVPLMFRDAISFNQPLENWNVYNVTDMFIMFWGASSFNQPLNNWNVSHIVRGACGPIVALVIA